MLERFLFTADIDVKVSYLQKQLTNYVPWHPDSELLVGMNAFILQWKKLKFSLLALLQNGLQKLFKRKHQETW